MREPAIQGAGADGALAAGEVGVGSVGDGADGFGAALTALDACEDLGDEPVAEQRLWRGRFDLDGGSVGQGGFLFVPRSRG